MTLHNRTSNPDGHDWKRDTDTRIDPEAQPDPTPPKRDIRELRERVKRFAEQNAVTSVRAFGDCERNLMAAVARRSTERRPWIERAHTHFQILKAAAAEKATRGR